MAGDGWAVDITFHAMIIVANALANFWSNWSIEFLVGASFGMQFVLTIFAGFRWRGASPKLRFVIWLFYVGGDYIATTALGNLSVSSASGERRLVAFWAPFFLLHLGGPDSITAYELEDNELSARYVLELVLRVLGALYVVYKSISGSWTLILAAWLILTVGIAKYVEKTLALHRANLGNVRSSVKNQRRRRAEGGRRHHSKPSFPVDDSALVMTAHSLFYICKRAIVDSSVEMESDDDAADTKETLFHQLEWDQQCKVMEMELSLMYDFLYTKASVIHSWHGYCIRVFSPLFTAVALPLVEFSNEDGRHKHSDVVITRILLVATLLLETASLLTALASSWTACLLDSRLRPGWLRHQVLCTNRWQRFRRAVASFARFAKVHEHRRWSGKIGQLNLLQLITRGEQPSSCAAKEQDYWGNTELYKEMIPPDVKELVFRRVKAKLADLRRRIKGKVSSESEPDLRKITAQFRTKRGQKTLDDEGLHEDLRWSLGHELQVGILTWHIATDIYLFDSGKANNPVEGTRAARLVMAIRMLSDYMMYLLLVRPDMLPDVVARRLHEQTCEDLVQIWSEHRNQGHSDLEPSSSYSSLCNVRVMLRKLFQLHDDRRISSRLNQKQKKLAKILRDFWRNRDSEGTTTTNTYLSSGIELGEKLLSLDDDSRQLDMVEVILNVWVDMLFYASYRCSKESHAKQLSYGGELTTVVWLMAEHVGLFVIDKTRKASAEQRWKKSKGDKGRSRTSD